MLSPGSGSLPQPPGSMLWHALECEHTQNKKHKDKWLLHSHTNNTCTYRDRHTWTLHKVSLPTYTSANRLSFPSHTLQHVPASNHVISFFPFLSYPLPPLFSSLFTPSSLLFSLLPHLSPGLSSPTVSQTRGKQAWPLVMLKPLVFVFPPLPPSLHPSLLAIFQFKQKAVRMSKSGIQRGGEREASCLCECCMIHVAL